MSIKDEWDGSVVCDILLSSFFIYDKYGSSFRANTHGAKVFTGLINVSIIG